MGCYSRFMTRFPWVLIIIDIVIVAVCGPLAYFLHGLPTFEDPVKGFQTTGTRIQGREGAASILSGLINDGNYSYTLSPNTLKRKKRSPVLPESAECYAEKMPLSSFGRQTMMIESVKSGEDLFTVDSIKAICEFEKTHVRAYWPIITEECPLHSIPYYMAARNNKICSDITQEDMDDMKDLLTSCAQYYFDQSLAWCYLYNDTACVQGTPSRCREGNVVYKILYYLADKNFMPAVPPGQPAKINTLKYTLITFRDSHGIDDDAMSAYYLKNLDGKTLSSPDGKVHSKSYDLGIFFDVFGDYVIMDLPYYALAMGLVLFVIIIYMRSIILTFVIMFTVIFSLAVSYFLYFVVFRFSFFPFMNLLAGLLLIAVGADDVFIIRDIWIKYSYDENDQKVEIESIVSKTLSHGAMSIFVTSLTTAAALFANIVSSITVLKCFSIFAGTCILVNFFFMITWVPAIMVLMEKCERSCCTTICSRCDGCAEKLRKFSEKIWGKIMPVIVLKVWPLWLILFLAIGVGGAVLVFYKPKLTSPKTGDIKLFYDTHPFEIFINKDYKKFQFEVDEEEANRIKNKLVFYWGLVPSDFKSPFNPDDQGRIEIEESFSMYTQEGQEWLLKFTDELLKQPFMPTEHKYANTLLDFKNLIEGPCMVPDPRSIPPSLLDLSPCCDLTFPVNSSMARTCFQSRTFYHFLYGSVAFRNQTMAGVPIFDPSNNKLQFYMIIVTTNRTSSDLYYETKEFYDEIDKWATEKLEAGPEGLNKGFWTSYPSLGYFDILSSLAEGTYMGIGLSLGVGFLVLLFTSMNIFLTTYAILTIALAILSTIGILVLAGWELGSFESLSITLAVGLSIDFTIHYGISYKVSESSERAGRVTDALSMVGFALAMAALTTFLAGSALMGGRVVGYRNFGVFLMTCMAMSWLFATFLFLPLCRFIGPLGNIGDLMYFLKCKWRKRERDDLDYQYPRSIPCAAQKDHRPNNILQGHIPYTDQGKINPAYVGPPPSWPPGSHSYMSSANSNMYLPGVYQAQVVRGERAGHSQVSPSHLSSGYYSYQSGVGSLPPAYQTQAAYYAPPRQAGIPNYSRQQGGDDGWHLPRARLASYPKHKQGGSHTQQWNQY